MLISIKISYVFKEFLLGNIMNKKIGVIVLFLLIFSGLVIAQVDTGGIEESAEKIKESTEKLQELTAQENSRYLAQQWKSLFLNNSIVGSFDNVMRKSNTLFFVLLGKNYDFTLNFIFILFLWIVFFITFSNIVSVFGTFNKHSSYISAFLFAVILGHFKLYEVIFKGMDIVGNKFGFWGETFGFLVFFIAGIIWMIMSEQTMRALKKKHQTMNDKKRLDRVERMQEETNEVLAKAGDK